MLGWTRLSRCPCQAKSLPSVRSHPGTDHDVESLIRLSKSQTRRKDPYVFPNEHTISLKWTHKRRSGGQWPTRMGSLGWSALKHSRDPAVPVAPTSGRQYRPPDSPPCRRNPTEARARGFLHAHTHGRPDGVLRLGPEIAQRWGQSHPLARESPALLSHLIEGIREVLRQFLPEGSGVSESHITPK